MKRVLLAVAIGMALSSPLVQAADKDAGAAPGSSKSQAQSPAEFDKKMARLQQQMSQMQAQMDQIRKTQDPQEREKLLKQHWDTMQSAMSTMREMWGPGMMGGGMMGGGMQGNVGPGWGHMGGILLTSDARTTEAAAVHDGPVHEDATGNDEQHDVASTVLDGAPAGRSKMILDVRILMQT